MGISSKNTLCTFAFFFPSTWQTSVSPAPYAPLSRRCALCSTDSEGEKYLEEAQLLVVTSSEHQLTPRVELHALHYRLTERISQKDSQYCCPQKSRWTTRYTYYNKIINF